MRSNAAYLTAVFLLLFIMTAGAQEPDTAYLARVQDTVDRYYRLHPRKRIPRDYRNFEVTPLFGVMYTQETGVVAMGGFMGGYRTSADTLLPMSSVGVAALVSTNLSLAGAVTRVRYAPAGKILKEDTAGGQSRPRLFLGVGFVCVAGGLKPGSFFFPPGRGPAARLVGAADQQGALPAALRLQGPEVNLLHGLRLLPAPPV